MTQESENSIPPSQEARSYGDIATRGLAWMSVVVVVSRFASLGSQIVLGWVLAENDFALYGLAIGIGAMVHVLRDGGTTKVLLQRGRQEYGQLAKPVLQMSVAFNLIAATLLVAFAPLAVRLFDTEDIEGLDQWLVPLIWVFALAIPFGSPVARLRVRLSLSLRFKDIAKVETRSALIRHSSMVAFALLGFGPLSFVLPQLVASILEWVMYSRAARGEPQPGNSRLTWPLFKDLFSASKWLMAGAFAGALVNYGEKLSIGAYQPESLGAYVFAFGLSAALATMFGESVRSVLTATFVQLVDDRKRRSRAFMQMVRMLSYVTAPLFVIAAIMTPAAIDTIWWTGKWSHTIPAVQILLLSLVARMLTPLALAKIESLGRWPLQAGLLLLDGVGTVLAAIIGARLGGLVAIALAVSINRTLMSILQCMVAARLSGAAHPVGEVLFGLAAPYLLAAAGIGAALALGAALPTENAWIVGIAGSAAFVIVFAGGSFVLMPRRTAELLRRCMSLIRPEGKGDAGDILPGP